MNVRNRLTETDRSLFKWSLNTMDQAELIADFENNSNDVNWDVFVQHAHKSHLSGFIHWNFASPLKDKLKQEVWLPLQTQYVQILQSNLRFVALHEKMLQALEGNNIPFAVLKGMDLLFRIYRELGIRHLSDIDLLILPEDLEKVKLLFESIGFKCKQSIDKSTFHERQFQLHAALQARFNGLNIDVDILLYDTFLGLDFPTENLLKNRVKIYWKDQYTWVLKDSDAALFNILHLYVHLDKGNHFKMSSFIDVVKSLPALNYNVNKKRYDSNVQRKVEYVIDCLIWLGLIKDEYLPNRKRAPERYYFYLLFFLNEVNPTPLQLLRYKFLPRFFVYSLTWKSIPLLFREIFPSKRYLNYGSNNRNYISAWFKRFKHFTRKE